MGALVRIVSSATSFRPTLVLTSRAARSVVSMIRWMAATSHSTSRVASLNEYFLLASSGRRPIQNRLHRKVVETNGAESSCEAISPRWMKICSSSVIPVDWPAVASVGTGSTLKAYRLDGGRLVGGRKHQPVADLDPSGGDAAGDDPARVEFVHVLHGEAQSLPLPRSLFPEQAERLQHRRTGVPGHMGAWLRDVIAELRAHRHEAFRRDLELCQEGPVLRLDRPEHVLPVADQVHLVDDDGHLPDAEQGEEVAVLLGLLLDALVGVDHQERCFGARRAGDHVLQELLVARRVDDDVVAAPPLGECAGCVGRGGLFLLLQEGGGAEGVPALP